MDGWEADGAVTRPYWQYAGLGQLKKTRKCAIMCLLLFIGTFRGHEKANIFPSYGRDNSHLTLGNPPPDLGHIIRQTEFGAENRLLKEQQCAAQYIRNQLLGNVRNAAMTSFCLAGR